MRRRDVLAAAASLVPTLVLPGRRRGGWAQPPVAGEGEPFDAARLVERARAMAREPHVMPEASLPEALAELGYDAYRSLRFRPERALWAEADCRFRVQLFHMGFLFEQPVAIHELADGVARPLVYDPELFELGDLATAAGLEPSLGFAGFRVHHPLNRPDRFDEIAAFLGASYFRALGMGQRYGKSARGLALGTATPAGEEFPAFRAFWLERPAPEAASLVVHALLDSASCTGAYRLVLHPGATTLVDVEAQLFFRNAVEKLGVAPLTSMYLFGENDRLGYDDFRPEVHDSDGLALWNGAGEWLWRPLVNPSRLRVSTFLDRTPRGFGLLQRDRDFASYQDLEAAYHRRPSLWVQPLDDWGAGSVELVEIPSDAEIHDNIVAFWVPETPVGAGDERSFRYRLHWASDALPQSLSGRVAATRVGRGGIPGTDPRSRKFVIDFQGGQLANLPDAAPVEAVASSSSGLLGRAVAERNPHSGGWRAFFDLVPEDDGPVELRCFLRLAGAALTEIWSYQWTA